MALVLQDINHSVEGETYLDDINITFEPGSFNVLLGRTGAGKTSLMRVIAGLDKPASGRIFNNDVDVTELAVQKRNLSMVYQQFINFPNMTVAQNIASPLKLAGVSAKEIEYRVRQTAEMLHIESFLQRYPLELSGGQQQRCAMARALVKDADIILFDEPLVNLDYKLREALRSELKSVFKSRDCVAIYATTESHEALALGGATTLLYQGKILQSGPAYEQYSRPVNLQAADLFHEPPLNVFNGIVREGQLRFNGVHDLSTVNHLAGLPDGEYCFAIRPDHLHKVSNGCAHLRIECIVELAEIGASETFLHVGSEELKWVAQLSGIHPMHTQTAVTLFFQLTQLFVFDQHGKALAWPEHGQIVGCENG